MGAAYILKTLRTGIGGLVRLGALYDQIQLTYSEIIDMMKPNSFDLDLITEDIPLHVTHLHEEM